MAVHQRLLFAINSVRSVLDVQASRLVIRTVGSARNLTVSFQSGHPRLDVVLSVSRCAQIFRRHVQYLEVEPEFLKHLSLNPNQLLVKGVRLLRSGNNEHFHFAKLMQSIHTASLRTRSSSFGTEAMTERSHLDGKLSFVDNLIHVDTTKKQFRGTRHAQVGVFNAIDLRVFRSRLETALFNHATTNHVWHHHRLESFAHDLGKRPVNQRQLQHSPSTGEVHKTAAAYLTSGLEIEHSEFLANINVVLHWKCKVALRANRRSRHRVFLRSFRNIRVRQVG
mmetsp:Transcript_6873/g.25005  ORF Transcript_6873/g.25005 Transcript_6873/m.25005 type:complete len:280 (-) Transcript_6873:614-1453(-)